MTFLSPTLNHVGPFKEKLRNVCFSQQARQEADSDKLWYRLLHHLYQHRIKGVQSQ